LPKSIYLKDRLRCAMAQAPFSRNKLAKPKTNDSAPARRARKAVIAGSKWRDRARYSRRENKKDGCPELAGKRKSRLGICPQTPILRGSCNGKAPGSCQQAGSPVSNNWKDPQ
jgi:hypothetical protein